MVGMGWVSVVRVGVGLRVRMGWVAVVGLPKQGRDGVGLWSGWGGSQS